MPPKKKSQGDFLGVFVDEPRTTRSGKQAASSRSTSSNTASQPTRKPTRATTSNNRAISEELSVPPTADDEDQLDADNDGSKHNSDDDEVDQLDSDAAVQQELVAELSSPKRSQPAPKTYGARGKRKAAATAHEEEEEPPAKKQAKGRGKASAQENGKGKGKEKAPASPPKKGRGKGNGRKEPTPDVEDDDDEGGEDDEVEEAPPAAQQPRPAAKSPRKKPSSKAAERAAAAARAEPEEEEDEDEGEGEDEEEPAPKASGSGGKSPAKQKKKPAAPSSSSSPRKRKRKEPKDPWDGNGPLSGVPSQRQKKKERPKPDMDYTDPEDEVDGSDSGYTTDASSPSEAHRPDIFWHLQGLKKWVRDRIWLHDGYWAPREKERWERRITSKGGKLVNKPAEGVLAILPGFYDNKNDYPALYKRAVTDAGATPVVHTWLDICYDNSRRAKRPMRHDPIVAARPAPPRQQLEAARPLKRAYLDKFVELYLAYENPQNTTMTRAEVYRRAAQAFEDEPDAPSEVDFKRLFKAHKDEIVAAARKLEKRERERARRRAEDAERRGVRDWLEGSQSQEGRGRSGSRAVDGDQAGQEESNEFEQNGEEEELPEPMRKKQKRKSLFNPSPPTRPSSLASSPADPPAFPPPASSFDPLSLPSPSDLSSTTALLASHYSFSPSLVDSLYFAAFFDPHRLIHVLDLLEALVRLPPPSTASTNEEQEAYDSHRATLKRLIWSSRADAALLDPSVDQSELEVLLADQFGKTAEEVEERRRVLEWVEGGVGTRRWWPTPVMVAEAREDKRRVLKG